MSNGRMPLKDFTFWESVTAMESDRQVKVTVGEWWSNDSPPDNRGVYVVTGTGCFSMNNEQAGEFAAVIARAASVSLARVEFLPGDDADPPSGTAVEIVQSSNGEWGIFDPSDTSESNDFGTLARHLPDRDSAVAYAHERGWQVTE